MFATVRPGVQNRYQSSVLIGNWREDQSLQQLKVQEYLSKKATGSLLIQHVDTHLKDALQEVGLSYSADSLLHFGDHVMLYSVNTEGVLSCDPSDSANAGERAFGVSTSTLTKAHVARNTFVIEPFTQSQSQAQAAAQFGDVLRYGDLFRLRVNPKLCHGEPFYLHSQPVGGISSSKVSRHQEASMSANGQSFDTVWKCVSRDIGSRFEMETQPISSSSELLIIHANTHQALSSAPLRIVNEFGAEFEVCCHTHTHTAKNAGLYQEQIGKRTGVEASRSEHTDNHWIILTASTPDRARLLRRDTQQTLAHIHHLLSSVQSVIVGKGLEALNELSLSLWLNDREKIDCLPDQSFVQSLAPLSLDLSAGEWELVCNHYDKANDGYVDYSAFLAAVRGPLKAARLDAVRAAYQSIDDKGDDCLSLEQVLSKVNDSATVANITALKQYFTRVSARGDGINFERFLDFYSNVSAFIESDDYFAETVKQTWRL